jgi:hypothetical protein
MIFRRFSATTAALAFTFVMGCGGSTETSGTEAADAVGADGSGMDGGADDAANASDTPGPGGDDASPGADVPQPSDTTVDLDAPTGSDAITDLDTVSPSDTAGEDTSGDPDAGDTPDAGGPDVFVWTPDPDTVPLFEAGPPKTLELTLTQQNLDGLLGCWSKPPADVLSGASKCWYHCTATFGGKTSVDAGCRPKGSPSKWNEESKPQFVVRFDQWDKTGRFFGLRRFNLESNPDFASPVRDELGMWFMREAGLPASRVALVRVTVNGNDYGPYQSIEPIDKEFLSDHFVDPEGNLFDDALDLATNEKTGDRTRFDAFLAIPEGEAVGGDHTQALTDLDVVTDLDAIIRFMAAEAALGTVDNFTDGAGNTYFYDQTPGPGILAIPWDLDSIFSKFSNAAEPLDTCQGPAKFSDAPNPLCVMLQDIPAMRAKLRAETKKLRDEVFPGLAAVATAACAAGKPLFMTDPFTPFTPAEYDADCAAIAQAIADRAAFLAAAPELQ